MHCQQKNKQLYVIDVESLYETGYELTLSRWFLSDISAQALWNSYPTSSMYPLLSGKAHANLYINHNNDHAS